MITTVLFKMAIKCENFGIDTSGCFISNPSERGIEFASHQESSQVLRAHWCRAEDSANGIVDVPDFGMNDGEVNEDTEDIFDHGNMRWWAPFWETDLFSEKVK